MNLQQDKVGTEAARHDSTKLLFMRIWSKYRPIVFLFCTFMSCVLFCVHTKFPVCLQLCIVLLLSSGQASLENEKQSLNEITSLNKG